MNAHNKFSLATLKKLHAVSKEMLDFAKNEKWEGVLKCDVKRLELLQNPQKGTSEHDALQNDIDTALRKKLVKEILELDSNIKELAIKERKSVMNKEIRQKAQVTAQSMYRQALTPDAGL